MAEEEGFEPSYPYTRVNGFRDRRIRPLCHPSRAHRRAGILPPDVMAESPGFEPGIRFRRIHDFQSCSFSHSDNSPQHSRTRIARGTFTPQLTLVTTGCSRLELLTAGARVLARFCAYVSIAYFSSFVHIYARIIHDILSIITRIHVTPRKANSCQQVSSLPTDPTHPHLPCRYGSTLRRLSWAPSRACWSRSKKSSTWWDLWRLR